MRNNPELEMPEKPVPEELGAGPLFYNVDFSLQNQLRMATGAPPPPNQGMPPPAFPYQHRFLGTRLSSTGLGLGFELGLS